MLPTIDAYSSLDLSGANLKNRVAGIRGSRSLIKLEARATIAPPTSPVRVGPNAKAKEAVPRRAFLSPDLARVAAQRRQQRLLPREISLR